MPRPAVRLSMALLALLAAAPVAHATSFTLLIATSAAPGADPATVFTATATISGAVDPSNPNAFDITSVTGSGNGFTFLDVVDPGAGSISNPVTDQGFTFNNVLYLADPHVDSLGFLLDIQSPIGISLAHVFSVPISAAAPGGYEVDVVDPRDPGAVTPFAITTFSVVTLPDSTVPEPSTLALLGTGLAGIAGLVRRRLTR